MKKALLLSGAALVAILSSNAFAEGQAGDGPSPYVDCGIGAALFPNHRVGAIISNVIWDVGTTAVTSATASPETCNGKTAQAAKFILESYDQLVEETAKGSGEHLTTLLNILEVTQEQQQAAIVNIRSNVASSIASDDYNSASKVDKANSYYNHVMEAVNS